MGLIGISGHMGSGKDTVGRIIQGLLIGEDKFVNGIEGFLEAYDDVDETITPLPYTIKKFADKLKDCVSLITNCSREDLEKPDVKNALIPEYDGVWLVYTDKYQDTPYNPKWFKSKEEAEVFLSNENCVYWYNITPATLTFRQLLQQLGTNVGRVIHPDIWVNALISEYKPYSCTEVSCVLVDNQYVVPEGHGKHSGTIVTTPSAVYEHSPKLPNWIITDMRFPNELKAVKDKEGITIRVNRLSVEQSAYERAKHESETALDNATFDYVIENNGTIKELVEKVREILIKEKLL